MAVEGTNLESLVRCKSVSAVQCTSWKFFSLSQLNISLRLACPDKPLTFNEHIFKNYNGENQLLLFCIEKPSTVTNIYKAKQGCN